MEIIHKREITNKNKNLIEEKSKRKNDSLNDQLFSKKKVSRNNNENINNNNNNKNDNNSIIYIKCENISNIKLNNTIVATKTHLKLNEDKKEKENKKNEKKEEKKNQKEKRLEREERKENDKEDKKDEKKENKKDKKDEKDEKKENKNIGKKDKYLSHVRLITSISKERNQPKKIDYDDNTPKLYTYISNLNKNKMNNISERINTSIDKKEDESTNKKKRNNHSLYICNSFDKEKKYKKICKSREANHQINESIINQINNYHNCSFKSINFSHSKSKKIKNLINKKVIKNHLFDYFSSESKKKKQFNNS